MPVKIKSDGGFAILINQLPICDFGQDAISCSQPIDKDLNFIENEKSPVNKLDAVDNSYVERININQPLVIFLILLGKTIYYSLFRYERFYQ